MGNPLWYYHSESRPVTSRSKFSRQIPGAGRPTPLGEKKMLHAWATVCHVFLFAHLRKEIEVGSWNSIGHIWDTNDVHIYIYYWKSIPIRLPFVKFSKIMKLSLALIPFYIWSSNLSIVHKASAIPRKAVHEIHVPPVWHPMYQDVRQVPPCDVGISHTVSLPQDKLIHPHSAAFL